MHVPIHLIYVGTPPHARDLAPPHIRNLEVGVQQEGEGQGLRTRVVHRDVKVELLLSQDEAVC